jgi:hypothetical protein
MLSGRPSPFFSEAGDLRCRPRQRGTYRGFAFVARLLALPRSFASQTAGLHALAVRLF